MAIAVGFHRDDISCEREPRGVRRDAVEANGSRGAQGL